MSYPEYSSAPWQGTTFTINTRDPEFAKSFSEMGKSLHAPAEFFGRKWYLVSNVWGTGPDGFHGIYVFQRLEEVQR